MITRQDRLEEYKKAVRLKYEMEKNGDFSSFLFNPSRGKLRDLCMGIFKQNTDVDDLRSFRLFFGFDYSLDSLNKLRDQKDKFRPIETFFKGETDLQDIEGINIAAILVNFKSRPFAKYVNQHTDNNSLEKEVVKEEDAPVQGFISTGSIEEVTSVAEKKDNKPNGFFFWIEKNKFITIFLIIASLLGGFSLAKFVFPEKECMQWQNDRYQVVDCIDPERKPSENNCIPLEKSLLNFRKVEVSDTTVFFNKHGKPLFWYCKVKGKTKPDFFNSYGNGYHPETGKKLHPITQYIINRYVLVK